MPILISRMAGTLGLGRAAGCGYAMDVGYCAHA